MNLPGKEENPRTIGTALDDLFGVWSAEEAAEFDAALEIFDHVDEEVWEQ